MEGFTSAIRPSVHRSSLLSLGKILEDRISLTGQVLSPDIIEIITYSFMTWLRQVEYIKVNPWAMDYINHNYIKSTSLKLESIQFGNFLRKEEAVNFGLTERAWRRDDLKKWRLNFELEWLPNKSLLQGPHGLVQW